MKPAVRKALPWVFVLLAVPIALLGLDASAPGSVCNQIPTAFSAGATTEQSETLEVVASHCEVTSERTGVKQEETEVNGSGLAAAVALFIGAWLLGATLSGQVGRRPGTAGIVSAGCVIVVALAVFFF